MAEEVDIMTMVLVGKSKRQKINKLRYIRTGGNFKREDRHGHRGGFVSICMISYYLIERWTRTWRKRRKRWKKRN